MNDETIVLELTPREAAMIYELCYIVNWAEGGYGEAAKDIFYALAIVSDSFSRHRPWAKSKTCLGTIESGDLLVSDEL